MERPPLPPSGIKRLRLKVGVLVAVIPLIVIGLAAYALYSRGVFEASRTVVLVAHNAEGVSEGMPVMFSGFPIGNVAAMALTEDGRVRIELTIRERDARWLRTSTQFTLDKQLLGGAKIRAVSPRMQDPPLEQGAMRELAARDAAEDFPQLVAKANSILENIDALVRPDSSLNRGLANLKTFTARLAGDYGLLEGVTGSRARARRIAEALEKLDDFAVSLNRATDRLDGLFAKSDERLFGEQGIAGDAQRTVKELHALLSEAREGLKKADAVLSAVQSTAAGVNEATTDLATLRAEVDDSVRKVNSLLTEINRKWPFARESQIKLP
jgi:phospholipid/cholesterol/gamma-HCH transport system substrate-binding protein